MSNPLSPDPAKTAVALVYWGRLGAGAALMEQLSAAMARDPRFVVYVSASLQSELAPALPADRVIAVSTFSGPVSLIRGTLLLPLTIPRIVRRMAAADIRVIVTVMPHLWGVALRRAAARAGIRTILMVHDADPHPGETRPVFDRLVRAEAGASDRVVTFSNHVADRLLARGDAEPGKLVRLFHPVFRFGGADRTGGDKTEADGTEADGTAAHPGSPFRLLFFGRVLPYKGLPVLLEAFARLREAGSDCVLRVVGRGRDPAAASLERQDGLSFEEGWVAPDAIGGILDLADALILPYREASQSGVVAAAYGAGLPVVVTPVGGLAEQVVDGETGIVAGEATPGGLVEAIRRLMETPGLYGACRAGIPEYAERHSFDRFADALGDAILEVAGSRPAAKP